MQHVETDPAKLADQQTETLRRALERRATARRQSASRWYRLHCIDCAATMKVAPQTIYTEHTVYVNDVAEAWAQAQSEGYWPLHVIDSDWIHKV